MNKVKMENGQWIMENRRGNLYGYPFLWDMHYQYNPPKIQNKGEISCEINTFLSQSSF